MPKVSPALFATVLLAAGAANAAPPTTFVPPGAERPRFGGEIPLTVPGPVAGYWPTECRTWRTRSHARRGAPRPSAEQADMFKRFVSGLITRMPNFDDMTPPMADAVRMHLTTYWPSFNRMGRATASNQFAQDQHGNTLFVVNQVGGRTHWNITVTPDGKITEAFICQGQGM